MTHSELTTIQEPPQWGYCDLVISAPEDAQVYDCFAKVVSHWSEHVTREQLWLEHDIPISVSFRSREIPDSLQRLFDAAPLIIARIEVEIGGLTVRYLRTGGHLPFRKSFFDTIELEVNGHLAFTTDELRALLSEFSECLHVVMARGSALFARIAAELSCARAPDNELRGLASIAASSTRFQS